MSSYVIDIDGVIGTKMKWSIGDSYRRARKTFSTINFNPAVVKKINELYKKGNRIVLHTSRIWHDYDVTIKWLQKIGVKYHILIMAKPLGDYYIDDRNLSVGEFLNGTVKS
jgi:uncharacterized HAD superfamily protein